MKKFQKMMWLPQIAPFLEDFSYIGRLLTENTQKLEQIVVTFCISQVAQVSDFFFFSRMFRILWLALTNRQ